MKKTILLLSIPLALTGIFLLYNSYIPIVYHNECNDPHLYRYQFGIYKIDTLGKNEVNFKQIGNVADYFDLDKSACLDGVYKYEQSLRKKEIDSVNKSLNWQLVKHNLYKNKNGELGFRELVSLGEGTAPVATYITKFGFNEGNPLNKTIDTATFTDLGSRYYKDKNYIYQHYTMAYGGSFYVNTDVDYKTFEVIGDVYAKDKNHIYEERTGIMEKADYKTFKTAVGIGPYAKDKNGYYSWGEKIDTLNQDIPEEKEAIKKLMKLR
jgi:hypothetical protein